MTATAMAMMMVTGSHHLIPGAVAGDIGPLHALQDHVHSPQDINGHARIPGDP
jgi:hypothetical protein